jgi:hypothetical protein
MKKTLLCQIAFLFLCFNLCSAEMRDYYEGNAHLSQGQLENNHLAGRIADDRYYSHDSLFSIAVPSAVRHSGYIEDHSISPSVAGVAFFNDYGFLLKVETDEVPQEVALLITQHPEIKEEVLDALFYEVLIPQLKSVIPDLKVLSEKKMLLDNSEPAVYAVLDMPRVATLINTMTGMPLDSKRGYILTFSQNAYLVNFSMQDTLTLLPSVAEAAKLRLNERLLSHLIESQRTYRPESRPPPALCY